jgi:hypothetical protein
VGGEAGPGVGAEDHDRNGGRPLVGPQAPEHLLARDLGQVQVQEDEVGAVLAGQLDAEHGPHGRDQRHTPAVHDPFDQLQVGRLSSM